MIKNVISDCVLIARIFKLHFFWWWYGYSGQVDCDLTIMFSWTFSSGNGHDEIPLSEINKNVLPTLRKFIIIGLEVIDNAIFV